MRHVQPQNPKPSAPQNPKKLHRYSPVDFDLGSRMLTATQIVPDYDIDNPDWLVGAY